MDTILSGVPEQLSPFVSDGRITAMPTKRAPRLLLLDQVAQAFEPGRRYDEATVERVLKTVTDDHATLRRYLVDEGFLSRTGGDGTYWRSGGSAFLPAREACPEPATIAIHGPKNSHL
ncbi:MAG TPA: DUF2087 domain-containing protein [Trebonia sp.]